MSWSHYIPTRIIFGKNCLKEVANAAKSFKPSKVLLVTGRKSMKETGVTDRVIDYLKDYQVVIYDKVEPNPTVRIVEGGIQFLKDEECDLVIGLGGGSAIDTAKAISVLAKNPGPAEEYLSGERKILNRRLPLIAIPTTAGTGTEVTPAASITSEKSKRKISLTHEYVHPDVAIVDPVLTATMPKFVTATTGLDALSQCIEAYWSKNRTPISDIFALNGAKLIFENLTKAFDFPDDLEFRENMALASLFSGMAISIAKTTIVHSVSYPLTVHFNVTHGLACSLTLPSFIMYNSKVVEDRILEIAKTAGVKTVEDFVRKIEQLISNFELPRRLSEVGIKMEDIDIIVKEGFRPDRAGNNPREVTDEDLRRILNDIF
jgi:phosphonate metabolism-associated iron-containing alcohol dehydrogenase